MIIDNNNTKAIYIYMVDHDQKNHNSMSTKKTELLSSAMKRTSEWIFSQEIPSDITINAAGTSFSLHKFPLISKSGLIRRLISESGDAAADHPTLDIPDIPGGAQAFELAAKFCYGINFEITTENIAALRCAAEHLQMSSGSAAGNLIERAEAYINEVALKTLAGAVTVLHSSEPLLPTAERVKLVSRCIDTIAFVACNGNQFSGADWWAEDLTVLRIDLFQRVLVAMIARGFKNRGLAPILAMYAQKSLRGLDIFGEGRKKIEAREEHEKRVVIETIVSLLPREKNTISFSFLSLLLRASIYLDTTIACRIDLEKRMGSQLHQAVVEDLLIPSYSFTEDTVFDIETVQRILTNFTESEGVDKEKVAKLMENYLAEVAADRNFSVSRFVSLAEAIPQQSRMAEDGMYRAIDVYLKAHPALSDMERKKVCSVMDCAKLSREACAHAAQNDRLPVQTVVQVLYYEQQRLREAVDGASSANGSPKLDHLNYSVDVHPVSEEVLNLRRENEELKLELVKMKTRMKEMMVEPDDDVRPMTGLIGSPRGSGAGDKLIVLPRKSLMSSVSKKFGRFMRVEGVMARGSKPESKPKVSKDRRRSIS